TPGGVEQIFEEQIEGDDLVLSVPLKLGMGFGLKNEMMPLPNDRCCFWGGWGGSLAIIDTEHRLSYSYVMNKMSETTAGDPRGIGPLFALYGAIA
ncbi:MAG: serine hydrolase, partial [Actinomycetota bacterium]